MKKSLFVFCDGGSRNNPGLAAIGFVVKDSSGKTLIQKGKYIGRATNNVAEYTAVIEALEWLSNYLSAIRYLPRPASPAGRRQAGPLSAITFFLDSQLVVNQLNGVYKVKNAHLRNLIIRVRQLEQEVKNSIFYRFIPRKKNRLADALVNQILKKNLTRRK